MPLEALWQRPRRIATARLEVDRVGESLVGSALNLVRNAKLACADLLLAQARRKLAEDGLALRTRLAAIAEARLAAGDSSQLESSVARVEAHLADVELGRLVQAVASAAARLRLVLGLGDATDATDAVNALVVANAPPELRALPDEATQLKLDPARSAKWQV